MSIWCAAIYFSKFPIIRKNKEYNDRDSNVQS